SLKGNVVALFAFQMLCPGCVSHSMPQAERLHRMLARHGVAVIGLHTVFEHHEAMTPVALKAFIHEYRLTFPIGVDQRVEGQAAPLTMSRYGMRGTPSTLIFDREGRLRDHSFGQVADLALGALIGSLIANDAPA